MTFALPPVRAPFPVTAPHRVVPSLRPLGSAPHVVLDASYPAVLARKVARLSDEPELCRVRDRADPDDAGLVAALLEALTVLARDTPEAVRLDGDRAELPGLGITLHGLGGTCPQVEATGAGWPVLGDLAAAARVHLAAVSDAGSVALLADTVALAGIPDWTVLRRRARGALATELLAVCLPSSWSPRDRAGADHVALHAPVGDNARLLAAGHALSEALLTKGPFLQYAWTVAPDDRLDLDPAAGAGQPEAAAAATSPADWYLRVERQTSVPLPALGRALFTIQLSLTPLTDVARDPARARVLADALATMSPATLAYKGLAQASGPLVAWLRASGPWLTAPAPRGR